MVDKSIDTTKSSPGDLLSMEERKALGKMIFRLFDFWELSPSDKLNLLGLTERNKIMLTRYAKGEALSANRDMMDRAGWLLSIYKSLKILYPQNEEICKSWILRRNSIFNNYTPLEVMKEKGIIGLAMVSRYLEHCQQR